MRPRATGVGCGPLAPFLALWRFRDLVSRLARREIAARYRGSLLGGFWFVLTPLAMLGVYTFVFSFVFQTRWGREVEHRSEFALVLFLGLIMFWFFSECVSQAPRLIVNHTNFVKKVVFPLQVLPWVVAASVSFHTLIRFLVFLVAYGFLVGLPSPSLLLLPLVFLPLLAMTLGVSWFLSALGVFARDMEEPVAVGITLALFVSPIFYPSSVVPEPYRALMHLNPLHFPIEQARDLLWGASLDWQPWLVHCGVSWLIAWAGFAWFARARGSFADVL